MTGATFIKKNQALQDYEVDKLNRLKKKIFGNKDPNKKFLNILTIYGHWGNIGHWSILVM